MSFTVPAQRTVRLNRSQLAVPASNPRFIEKAAVSDADVLFLDLEDSVSPDEKDKARANAIAALNQIDFGRRSVSLRINGLDTHYMYRDLIAVLEAAPDKLDLVMIPKVGCAADVYAVDMLITQIEAATGAKKRIGLEVLIESALGMANVDAIAAASPRLESLHLGPGDYAASIGSSTTTIGGPHPDYHVLTDADEAGHRAAHWGDMWHYPLSRIVVAARANGLRAIDGPYGNFSDADGLAANILRAKALGIEGKWAIHPTQIAACNQLFAPSDAEVEKAKAILAAMEAAAKDGRGAVALDGRLIDIASIRQAKVLIEKARRMGRA